MLEVRVRGIFILPKPDHRGESRNDEDELALHDDEELLEAVRSSEGMSR